MNGGALVVFSGGLLIVTAGFALFALYTAFRDDIGAPGAALVTAGATLLLAAGAFFFGRSMVSK
jgi:hypothetical protein